MSILFTSPMKKSSGMTLIELIFAMLISGILLGYGVVEFLNFNKTQMVKNVGLNIKNEIRRIQAKALAGVKPQSCAPNGIFDGYQVDFLNADATYCPQAACIVSQAICDGVLSGDTNIYTLTPEFTFYNSAQPSITFYALAGGTDADSSTKSRLVIKGYDSPNAYYYRMCITKGGDIKDCGFTDSASYDWNASCGGCP